MKDYYAAYVKRVVRELDLPRRQKKDLLHGFRLELEERFAEPPSMETLLHEVGQPDEVASSLLTGVDMKERKRHSLYRLFRIRLVVVILALLLALSVGAFCYYDASRVGRSVVTITEDAVFTQPTTIMNDD